MEIQYIICYIKNIFFIDMEIVKIGGPVYRIGVGGGAASSVEVCFLQIIIFV